MNGTTLRAVARLRQAVQPGTVFLLEGTDDSTAGARRGGAQGVIRSPRSASPRPRSCR